MAAGNERLQSQYRDRAVGSVEINLQTMRLSATRQFQEQAWLDVASLNINQTQIQGSPETGLYNLDLQAQAEGPQIFATQTHGTAFEQLIAPDDPFRGLAAVVNTVNVTADAQSTLSASSTNRFSLPSMALTPQLSVRQIPASEFTLFSASTGSFEMRPELMPITGRIHTEGDLVISGGPLASIYPVTAGGNISLANEWSTGCSVRTKRTGFDVPRPIDNGQQMAGDVPFGRAFHYFKRTRSSTEHLSSNRRHPDDDRGADLASVHSGRATTTLEAVRPDHYRAFRAHYRHQRGRYGVHAARETGFLYLLLPAQSGRDRNRL